METVKERSSEQVLAFARKCIYPDLPRFALAVILILIPFFFFFFLMQLGAFGFILFLLMLGGALLYLLRTWIIWFYSVLIITDERIIDSQQSGLFKREVTEIEVKDIEEVETVQGGLFHKLCRLGDLHIRTSKDHKFDVKFPDLKKYKEIESLMEAVVDIHAEPTVIQKRKMAVKVED